jgi:hypothetical protein
MSEHDTLDCASARIVIPTGARAGEPTTQDLDIINSRFAVEPLTADEVFVFPMVISTDAVDTYFTHMLPSSLRNFSEDFTAGRSLLDSHVISRLNIGKSFVGGLESIKQAEGTDATMQVLVRWYMLRDHQINGQNSEQYRRGILGGIYAMGSIGFGGSEMRYVCDIDGKGLWESDYYPGQRLKNGQRVTFGIDNARALEGSLVYKNSTPGALVQRVQQLVTKREVDPADLDFLEHTWSVRFDAPPQQHFIGGSMTQETEARSLLEQARAQATMSNGTRQRFDVVVERATSTDEAAQVLAKLVSELDSDADLGRMVRQALGDNVNADGIAQLRTQATAGAAYTKRLIDEAVQAKTAVMGDSFTEEKANAYRQRLERMAVVDFDFITEQHEDWTAQRAATFTPGRKVSAVQPNGDTNAKNPHLTITERKA